MSCSDVQSEHFDHFNLIAVSNPQVVPRIYTINDIVDRPLSFKTASGVFGSQFITEPNHSYTSSGSGCLVFGPYFTFPSGTYNVTYHYTYDGQLEPGTQIGFCDMGSSTVDLSSYRADVFAGNSEVSINDVKIESEAELVETRFYTATSGVTVTSVDYVRTGD